MIERPVQPTRMTNKELWKLLTPYICLCIPSIASFILDALYSFYDSLFFASITVTVIGLLCGLVIMALAIIQRKRWARITAGQRMMMYFIACLIPIALVIMQSIAFGVWLRIPPTNLDKGMDAYDFGHYNDAITFLTLYIDTNPDSADAYYWRGLSYNELGSMNQALADFNQSINLGRDDAMDYQLRGVTYYALGQMGNALSDFNQSIKLDPSNYVTYYNRGCIEQSLKHNSEAIADFQKCLTLNPSADIRQYTMAALQQLGVTP